MLAGILIYFEHPEIYMPLRYQQIVTEQAEKHHIDEALIYAVLFKRSVISDHCRRTRFSLLIRHLRAHAGKHVFLCAAGTLMKH